MEPKHSVPCSKSLKNYTILSEFNSDPTVTPCFSMISLNIILPWSPKWVPIDFLTKILYTFHISLMHAVSPAHIICLHIHSNSTWRVGTVKLIMQFPPYSWYFTLNLAPLFSFKNWWFLSWSTNYQPFVVCTKRFTVMFATVESNPHAYTISLF